MDKLITRSMIMAGSVRIGMPVEVRRTGPDADEIDSGTITAVMYDNNVQHMGNVVITFNDGSTVSMVVSGFAMTEEVEQQAWERVYLIDYKEEKKEAVSDGTLYTILKRNGTSYFILSEDLTRQGVQDYLTKNIYMRDISVVASSAFLPVTYAVTF